jgi:hypothetical protein
MGLVLQLVQTRTDSQTRSVEVMEISRPCDPRGIANLAHLSQLTGRGACKPLILLGR